MSEVLKSSQPRHIEMAKEVSSQLMNEFSGEEQFEFMEEVRVTLTAGYKEKLLEAESRLKGVQNQFDNFIGNNLIKEHN